MLNKPRCAHLITLVDLKLAKWGKLPNTQMPRLVDKTQFYLAFGMHVVVAGCGGCRDRAAIRTRATGADRTATAS
jgi:hypothetical protein